MEDRPSGTRQVRPGDGEEENPRRGMRDSPARRAHPDGGTRRRPHRGADGGHGGVLQPPAVAEHPARHGLQRAARPVQRPQAVRLRRGQVHEEVHPGPEHGAVRAVGVYGIRVGQAAEDHCRGDERAGPAHAEEREVQREHAEQDAQEPRLHRRVPPRRHHGRRRNARPCRRGDFRARAKAVRREQAQGFPAGARHGRQRRSALLAHGQALLR